MKIIPSIPFVLFFIIANFPFTIPSAFYAETDSLAVEKIKEKRLEKEERELKKKEQCISLTNEETAALVANDWENLDRLAKAYAVECKGVFDAQWLSGAHENIAIANNAQGKFKYALAASDVCAKTYYGNPGCHIQKSRALIALGRKAEAEKSLEISEKLARHALEGAHRDLNQARSELDKELHTSSVARSEGYLNLIESMRTNLAQ